MEYDLTSSQKIFYTEKIDNSIWTQGALQIFPEIYSYEELNDAFNSLVENNDWLLMRITKKNSGPVAVLKEYRYTHYPFVSFETEAELYDYLKKYLNEPRSLFGRLVECVVFQTPTSSGIIVHSHHIAVDGYSGFVMAEYINGFLKKSDSFSKDTESYKSFIEKEKKYIESKRYISDKKFWIEQFSDNPITQIFFNNSYSCIYTATEKDYKIDGILFEKIKKFCLDNMVSISTFFNTVYSIYLHRKYNVSHFTIGVPVLNRTTQKELNTIGLYMHIVPLVISIERIDTFFDFLKKTENSHMNLFRHQGFSQYDIKTILKENNMELQQLFDIISDYENFKENGDYSLKLHYSNSLSVPIEIHLFDNNITQSLKIRYRTSVFTEKEIKTMLNSIMAIAEDALEHPDKKIGELEMLSADEKKKLIYDFNATAHTYDIPENSTLYSLFESTAKDNREKICIRTAEKEITFGDLLNISEKLDREIRKITEGKKSVVAVIAERSAEMYGAIYGIIRGGNAYLPIDPDYPQERIDYILENSGASAVAAQGKFTDKVKNIPCINMTELIEGEASAEAVVPCAAEENDTAYVIYTSGSTGTPKGARVSHKSAVNRILWMYDKYPLGADDVILQKTPYTFDVSVWEHFWWGMCAGSLAVSKPGEHFLPARILDEVEKNKVTHLHFVPSVFELFLNYLEAHTDERSKFASVRYVFLSGETLTANLAERFYELYDYNKVTLHNLYGPTECAVDVTYYDCSPVDIDPVPIGKPVYNTQIYIVDKYLKAVPVGVTGELCIAGMNVGQGYLNNPALTSEKFIDNPFGEGKLYRTGDLAYWREDGNIVFCGRRDNQVKLNGQRVEAGEIEAVISSVSGVESCAVLVRKINQKDVLVAFYCAEKDSEDEIRKACRDKLPKYMVPSFVIKLERMPINQNGKLDRKALSSISVSVNREESDTPLNDTERYICSVFEDILGEKNVGRNSDFFDIGGSSYSMISLLGEEGFENITAAEFMRNSTPALLASLLEGKNRIKEARYLEALYAPEKADRVMIILPFAGGGAEAFGKFVSSIKKSKADTAIYFIRYLHSVSECREAAEEIADFFPGEEIMFYSHCVGSAVALQIISELEKRSVSVKHYFAGASIPPKKPTRNNIWNYVSDRTLSYILSKAGAKIRNISEDNLSEMLLQFRKDTDFANISFFELNSKIRTPVSLIFSKRDFFTLHYRNAEKNWNRYVENIIDIKIIDDTNHYFQSTNSDILVETIF